MKKLSSFLFAISVASAGCTSGNLSGNTTGLLCAELTRTEATPPADWNGSVFTIVMENKSRSEIFGNPAAPYLNKLAAEGAVANGYHDSYVHPSEPNYIWMVAGQNFGVLDDEDPISHPIESTSHIADQLELADLSWKSYQQSMGAPCGLTSHGRYAAKHNPFIYFNDINGWDGTTFQPTARCQEHIVDYSQLDADIAANAIPKYAFITPDLDHDMHDGSIAQGDAWLAQELPKIMATDAYKNGGAIFILWDEGSNRADDPPFIVMSPHASVGMKSTVTYDTSSYLKTVQAILGLEPTPCAADPSSISTMKDLFQTPME